MADKKTEEQIEDEEVKVFFNIYDHMTKEQIAACKDIFTIYDKNGDGCITAEELGAVMSALGKNHTEAELKSMMASYDFNQDGLIDFHEFLIMAVHGYQQNPDSDKSLRQTFNVFDKDKDGFISAGELREVLTSLGEAPTDEEVNEMIQRADLDGDGKVNFEEFKNLMLAK